MTIKLKIIKKMKRIIVAFLVFQIILITNISGIGNMVFAAGDVLTHVDNGYTYTYSIEKQSLTVTIPKQLWNVMGDQDIVINYYLVDNVFYYNNINGDGLVNGNTSAFPMSTATLANDCINGAPKVSFDKAGLVDFFGEAVNQQPKYYMVDMISKNSVWFAKITDQNGNSIAEVKYKDNGDGTWLPDASDSNYSKYKDIKNSSGNKLLVEYKPEISSTSNNNYDEYPKYYEEDGIMKCKYLDGNGNILVANYNYNESGGYYEINLDNSTVSQINNAGFNKNKIITQIPKNEQKGYINEKSNDKEDNEQFTLIDDMVDGVVGLYFYPLKIVPLALGGVIDLAFSVTTGVKGIESILFNEVPILNVNFFEDISGKLSKEGNEIRQQVAIWYVSIRNIAAVLLILIAIYVGIRMALSTVAADKAKYKHMLKDWIMSIVLLFLLHYIMLAIVNINDSLVNLVHQGYVSSASEGANTNYFLKNSFSISFSEGLGSALAYFMLQIITFIFFLAYIKRMVTLAFLTIISPLVTVTYSIDKMGDGKSQALNTWFKEYAYNILIQPFQCVAFLALGTTAYNLLNNHSLGSAIIAIVMLIFIYQAEAIVKTIFGFNSKSMSETVASSAFAAGMFNSIRKTAGSAKEKKPQSDDSDKKNDKKSNTKASNPRTKDNTNEQGTNVRRGELDEGDGASGVNLNSNSSGPEISDASEPETRNSSSSGRSIKDSTLTKIGKRILKDNIKAAAILTSGAAGLATGDVKNMISAGLAGYGDAAKQIKKMDKNDAKRKLARAYNNYAAATGKSSEEIKRDAKDLMNGDMETSSYESVELKTAMKNMREFIADGDMSDKKIDKELDKTFADVESGKVSETLGLQTKKYFADKGNKIVKFTNNARAHITRNNRPNTINNNINNNINNTTIDNSNNPNGNV